MFRQMSLIGKKIGNHIIQLIHKQFMVYFYNRDTDQLNRLINRQKHL